MDGDEIRPSFSIQPNLSIRPSYDIVLQSAEQELERRKRETDETYKKELLVAAKAVHAVQMIEQLSEVIAQEEANGTDVRTLKSQQQHAHETLVDAVNLQDDAVVLHTHTQLERIMQSVDPFFLESEEEKKRQYLEHRNRENMERVRKSWLFHPSSAVVSILKGKGAQGVTEEERRSCISTCAWGFAIIGMLIAIIFVIIDFWSAQANPALISNLVRSSEIQLPPVYACLSTPLLPTFGHLPNATFNGTALWGLRSYTDTETGESYMYREAQKLITEPCTLGRHEFCQQTLQYLSKDDILEALDPNYDPAKKCFSCLRIGVKKPINLTYEKAEKRIRGAVTLEFARLRDFDYCFNPLYTGDTNLRDSIRRSLKDNAQQLVDKGILVLINSPSISFAFDYGFEDFRFAHPRNPIPQMEAMATVFCNLYFFSGHFFPVKPGTEVRYSYDVDAGLEAWKPLGNLSNFLTAKSSFRDRNELTADRFSILNEIGGNSTSAREDYTVNMFISNGPRSRGPTFHDYAATLREDHNDILLFSKTIDGGVESFSTSVQLGSEKLFRTLGRFTRFNISLDMETFEVEITTRRPTTSVSEFLTDVVEYIGLFTGVCAYSVLVGPARLYLKKTRTA